MHGEHPPNRRSPKDWLEARAEQVPLAKQADDPVVAGALWALVFATFVGVVLAGSVVFPADKDARGHVIQLAGGALLFIGAYFTANNLRVARSLQRSQRLAQALDQLGSNQLPVRIGAIRLLEGIAVEERKTPPAAQSTADAQKRAIRDALAAVRDQGAKASGAATIADEVYKSLMAREGWDPDRKDVRDDGSSGLADLP